jgi:predicted nucleic acid-binding Zn ribbon protein
MKDEKLTKCTVEACEQEVKGQGDVVRKVGGGAGLIFNGDGFYLTDYVKKSGGESKSSSSSTSSSKSSEPKSDSSSSGGESKSDSGTAPAKSESKPSSKE